MSFEDHIDQIIREGRANGAFDDLPGRGRPLRLEHAGDALAGVLKQAGYLPEWVELARKIEVAREEAARFRESYAAEYASARERLASLSVPRAAGGVLGRGLPGPRYTGGDGLAALNRRRAVALERYALLLREHAGLIPRFNSTVPFEYRKLPTLDLRKELTEFMARFPLLQRRADGGLQPVAEAVPEALIRLPVPGSDGAAESRGRQIHVIRNSVRLYDASRGRRG